MRAGLSNPLWPLTFPACQAAIQYYTGCTSLARISCELRNSEIRQRVQNARKTLSCGSLEYPLARFDDLSIAFNPRFVLWVTDHAAITQSMGLVDLLQYPFALVATPSLIGGQFHATYLTLSRELRKLDHVNDLL